MIADDCGTYNYFQTSFKHLPSVISIPVSPPDEELSNLPITPPTEEVDSATESILATAVHVLSTEAAALSCLTQLYASDPVARHGFSVAVDRIAHTLSKHGKIVVCGVGKSGKIGQKLVATMNSLGLMSVFLHPTEAVHGDMGIIRPADILLLLTYSGNTPELSNLVSHLPRNTQIIAMTAHTTLSTCPLYTMCPDLILLPAPIHEKEATTFGISAPTTSTTVTVALGDALALAVAGYIHSREGRRTEDVFRSYHPGGAIGKTNSPRLIDLAKSYDEMPIVDDALDFVTAVSDCTREVKVMDCLMRALHSTNGWLRLSDGSVIPPGRLKTVQKADAGLSVRQAGIAVPRNRWIPTDGKMLMKDAQAWVKEGDLLLVELPGRLYGVIEGNDVLSIC